MAMHAASRCRQGRCAPQAASDAAGAAGQADALASAAHPRVDENDLPRRQHEHDQPLHDAPPLDAPVRALSRVAVAPLPVVVVVLAVLNQHQLGVQARGAALQHRDRVGGRLSLRGAVLEGRDHAAGAAALLWVAHRQLKGDHLGSPARHAVVHTKREGAGLVSHELGTLQPGQQRNGTSGSRGIIKLALARGVPYSGRVGLRTSGNRPF